MSDTHETDSKRATIAKRDWLDKDGSRVPTGSPDVAGWRYTFNATGKSIEHALDPAMPLFDRQCAAMGGLTKIGNVVNSIVNADEYDGADPMPSVEEWYLGAVEGTWREIAEPGAGRAPKYDKDVLAASLIAVLGAKAQGDVASYRERLDDKSYYAKVRANPTVMAHYMKEMAARGKETAAADSLA